MRMKVREGKPERNRVELAHQRQRQKQSRQNQTNEAARIVVLSHLQLQLLRAFRRPTAEVVKYRDRSGEWVLGTQERPVDSIDTPRDASRRDATGKVDPAFRPDPLELSEDDIDGISTTAARAGALMRMRRWEADRAAAVA